MAKVLVLYYSSWGHVEQMAHAAAEGAREAGAEVTVKRVPELMPEEVARKAGYGTAEAMRRAFLQALDVSPAEYRRRI